jgi:ABC-type lipoprotein release transport system permease subunit
MIMVMTVTATVTVTVVVAVTVTVTVVMPFMTRHTSQQALSPVITYFYCKRT